MGRPRGRRGAPEPAPVQGARWVALTQDKFALVDAEDFERVAFFSWCYRMLRGCEHANRTARKNDWRSAKQSIFLHQEVLRTTEPIDHRNGNGLDNRKQNLRLAAQQQNLWNRRVRNDSSTGVKGITRVNSRWRARIKVNERAVHLGYFDTQEDAGRAYDAAARKFYGEFACTNYEEKT